MTSRHTPLHETHTNLGAHFTDFAGWAMPMRYGSELVEHRAVRTSAGLFDLSHMGQVEVTGPGAAAALDHALVGRPSKIGVGRARYSMVCREDGGIIDDLVVYRLQDDAFLVVANASNVDTVVSSLATRASAYQCDVADASPRWALVAIQGPASEKIVASVCDADVPSLRYYAIDPAVLGGHDVLLARTGYTGEDGFEVYCRPEDAVEVWAELTGAGRAHGLVPAGLACRDTLRLEAGMPLYGQELTAETSPFAAGLGRVVSFDKPDGFVGEDALERLRDEPVTQRLVGLVTSGRRSPRTGHTILDRAGTVVGRVTSGAPSPTLGRPIAMAYVDAAQAEPGNRLRVEVRGTREEAEVVELPFYRRSN